MFSLTSPQPTKRNRSARFKGGRVGSDPHSDGRSEDEALWRHRPPKAGVAPDLAMTPPAATARSEVLANTHRANGLTNTAGEGRAEV